MKFEPHIDSDDPNPSHSLTVPEVPTILIEGGAVYPGLEGGRRLIQFEVALLRLQLQVCGATTSSNCNLEADRPFL